MNFRPYKHPLEEIYTSPKPVILTKKLASMKRKKDSLFQHKTHYLIPPLENETTLS